MTNRRSEPQLEEDICIHIFAVSAGMVGVRLTAIGLVGLVITIRSMTTITDDLLAGDAFLFLVACPLWIAGTKHQVDGRPA